MKGVFYMENYKKYYHQPMVKVENLLIEDIVLASGVIKSDGTYDIYDKDFNADDTL